MDDIKLKIGELSTGNIKVEGFEVSIGEVVKEEFNPPDVLDLRCWDVLLVSRYLPKIVPTFTQCALCTYGPCDLTKMRGVCGIDSYGNHVRILTLAVSLGLSNITNRAIKMYKISREVLGEDYDVKISPEITISTPNISLITGYIPKKIKDFEKILNYVLNQNSKIQDSLTVFREYNPLDLASRMLHLGMLSHISCEIVDTLELLMLKNSGIELTPQIVKVKVSLEMLEKPTILYVGESLIPILKVLSILKRMNLGKPGDFINIIAASCNVANIEGVVFLGSPIYAIPIIRLGIPDVVIIDDTCISGRIVEECIKHSISIITISDSTTFLAQNISGKDINEKIDNLLKSGIVYVDNIDNAVEIAVLTCLKIHGKKIINIVKNLNLDALNIVKDCDYCGECVKVCPLNLDIVDAIKKLRDGNEEAIVNIVKRCVWCGLCEDKCPKKVRLLTLFSKYLQNIEISISTRASPLSDQVIRSIGAPIVLGEIPGVIAFVGCLNIRESVEDIVKIVHELLKRGFIVITSGCISQLVGKYRTEEGLSLYEEYGELGRGCIINIGTCTALSEVSGIAIRVANIFAGRKIKGNYEEIADYILNRVGACGIGWGASTHKILSIAVGFLRLGIPIIVGPQCSKLGISLEGVDVEKFVGIDMKTGKKVPTGPAPQHLLYLAKTPEECLIMAVKLCIRPGDTSKGRAVKLSHYIDLYKKFYGKLPPDLHLFIRDETDIPITYKDEVMQYLKEVGWKPWEYISTDVTISERVYSQYRK